MNRLTEKFKPVIAFTPAAQTAGASIAAGVYIDSAPYTAIDFIIAYGAIAATKAMNVEIYAADDESGTNAEKLDDDAVTAPAEGLTNGIYVVSVHVNALRKRYLNLRIGNTLATGTLPVSAVAICEPRYYPDGSEPDIIL